MKFYVWQPPALSLTTGGTEQAHKTINGGGCRGVVDRQARFGLGKGGRNLWCIPAVQGSFKLDENSFASFMVLHNLSFLLLDNAYEGKKLSISARSLPGLLELNIGGAPQLNQVEIEEGALGSLVKLATTDCPELKSLPHGIEYLGALEELYLINAADEFIGMLMQESETNECKEELMKISHIRKVIVESTEKNFWKRIVSRNVNEFVG